jgi:hypothetical protein
VIEEKSFVFTDFRTFPTFRTFSLPFHFTYCTGVTVWEGVKKFLARYDSPAAKATPLMVFQLKVSEPACTLVSIAAITAPPTATKRPFPRSLKSRENNDEVFII